MAAAPLRSPDPNFIDQLLCALVPDFPKALSEIIHLYVMERPDCFGAKKWLEYFNVDVGKPLYSNQFLLWWNDFDAVDRFEKRPNPRKNCETHVVVYRPEFIKKQKYALSTLMRLVTSPFKGVSINLSFFMRDDVWTIQKYYTTPAGPGCWLALRKIIVVKNLKYEESKEYIDSVNERTGAQYEREIDLLELTTALALQYVSKGKQCLIANSNERNRQIDLCCKDITNERENKRLPCIGFNSKVIVCLIKKDLFERVDVAALRKFEEG